MRRIATVTTCAPLARCACCMISSDGYLPVPTNKRELNSYLPMRSVSVPVSVCISAPCDRDDDLEPVAVVQHDLTVPSARHDVVVQRDRRPVAPHVQHVEQRAERRT